MLVPFTSLLPIVVAFLATCASILLLMRPAQRIGLVDAPGGRKQHTQITPVIGGISIFLGMLVGLSLVPSSLAEYRSFVVACGILVFIGVLDDFQEVSPKGRLIAQLIAIAVMIFWADIRLTWFGDLFGTGSVNLGWLAIPVTLFGAASLINAVNMLDGLDGLAGSVVLVAFMTLMFFAIRAGLPAQTYILAIINGCIIAFLCFNMRLPGFPHARVFMGDAGSMLLGFILAWFTINLSQIPEAQARPVTMLWVVGVPLIDIATVFIARVKQKRSPMSAGRDHIHHWLMERGASSSLAVCIITLIAAIMAGIAVLVEIFTLPDSMIFAGFITLFTVYLSAYFLTKKKDQP